MIDYSVINAVSQLWICRRFHPISFYSMAGQRLNCRPFVGMLAVAFFAAKLPDPSNASQYYFSAAGHDQTGDGTELQPWRSISKFNTLDLEPGDRVFSGEEIRLAAHCCWIPMIRALITTVS